MTDAKRAVTGGLRERNKQDKLERIRRAARHLFVTQGFAGATTDQIAREAGVAKGTLFLYARDKQELLFLVFLEDITRLIEQGFATLPAGALVDRLVHVFGVFLDFYAGNPQLSRLFVKELLFLQGDRHAEYHALNLAFFTRVGDLLHEGVAAGDLRPDLDPGLAAAHLFSVYAFWLVQWLEGDLLDSQAARVQLHHSFDLLFDGFRRRL